MLVFLYLFLIKKTFYLKYLVKIILFYDEDNHFFIYNIKSLDILCNKYNYHRKYKLNNFLYDFFGYFQSIQNFFTNIKMSYMI